MRIDTSPGKRAAALGIVAFILLLFWVYLPAVNGTFLWDDDEYVAENVCLRTWSGLKAIWTDVEATPQYYPLVHTIYWLEYRLWGGNPTGYHVVNILLHATGALLLGYLMRGLGVPGAWLTAAVFALHPVAVESVAWITERKNVLSAVLYLSAAVLYLRQAGVLPGRPLRLGSAAAFACFTGALLSKTVTATLPAALLVIIWFKRGKIRRSDVWPLVPFFGLAIGLGFLTAWLERIRVGAQGEAWGQSFIERCLIAGRIVWFYAGKLLIPTDLVFIYPRWSVDATDWCQYVPLLAAALTGAALWIGRKRFGRGPLAAVLLFVGTLFPALGFFNVYPMRFSFVADHFQYHASMWLLALFCALAAKVISRTTQPIHFRRLLYLIPLTLGLLSRLHASDFRDIETLWFRTIQRNPQAWIAHNNLGMCLLRQHRDAEAEICLRNALALSPDLVQAHVNLGVLLANRREFDLAFTHYERALALRPRYPNTQIAMANAYWACGRLQESEKCLETALQFQPENKIAHANLAKLRRQMSTPGKSSDQ